MMNFFEQQLRSLTKTAGFKEAITTFAGRVAFLPLSEKCCVRIEFVTCGTVDRYEAIKVTILNTAEGEINALLIRFCDYFSKSGGYTPYIWRNHGYEWYTKPSEADWKSLAKAMHDYIQVFA